MRPFDAKTLDEVSRLQTDNKSVADYYIMISGDEVTITHQKVGCRPISSMIVPRAKFNRMIGWYLREQKLRTAP